MRRTAVFILLCLLFGALLSLAVAWWATLREWEESDEFAFVDNGWKGGMEYTPARTMIGAIPVEQFGLTLVGYGIPAGFDYLTKTWPPAWFPLSIKPANQSAIMRGIGAGWPLTCVVVIQEFESESLFPEWDLVRSGGIVGTNPFGSGEDYSWNRNHLPLQVVPMGLFVDALVYGLAVAFWVLVVRLNLRLRANHHHRRKRCPYCRYDLSRSTSAVCSECGADPLRPPPIISRSTTVFVGVVTIILLMALVGFGVVFSAQFPFSQLHYAAYRGDISAVRSELAAGEDIDDGASSYNWFGMEPTDTPLTLACASGETEVVQFLIDSGADLEIQNSFGATALHMAISSGSIVCVSLLLENGADVNAKLGDYSDALLFIAFNPDNDPRLLDLLLEAGYKFEVNSGATDAAIGAAAQRDNEKFIHQMLELGAVPGYEALTGAVERGRVDWLELFVSHGADFGIVPEYSWPIVYFVRPDNNPREIVEFLIKHGQQVNAANENGLTALMVAAMRGQPDLCRIFLDFGADPNLRDDSGKNALDHAIEFRLGNIEGLISVLLDAGAEVRLVDERGEPRFDDLDPKLLKILQDKAAANSTETQPGQ